MTMKSNERGMSIVSVMVALVVFGLLAAGMTRYLASVHTNLMQARIISNRDHLEDRIRRSLLSVENLRLSAALTANAGLRRCFSGNMENGCVYTKAAEPRIEQAEKAGRPERVPSLAFPAYIRQPGKAEGAGDNVVISGIRDRPLYYSIDGHKCPSSTRGNGNCPFEVTTSFVAYCKDDAVRCRRAEAIEVFYRIAHAPGALADGQNVRMRQVLKEKYGSVTIGLTDLPSISIPVTATRRPGSGGVLAGEAWNLNCLYARINNSPEQLIGCNRDDGSGSAGRTVPLTGTPGMCNTVQLSFRVNGVPTRSTANQNDVKTWMRIEPLPGRRVRVRFEDGGYKAQRPDFDFNDLVFDLDMGGISYRIENSEAVPCA